ncbi:ATP-binding cassette domain-containing protein [uncultured Robinsoniella sp.]|uniref:ABC transporter ATP-binding protein n=1 Tax=uncultured Robinsoniella sp. TaxID=904190 RepID=UPI00374F87AB
MDILEVKNLKKSFNGHAVIKDLSFQVPEHSVFGFLGENGAGKTTTMKMILGLLQPDDGEIRIAGNKVSYGETKTNRMIGYLPDVPEFYSYMRAKEYLKLCGEVSGMTAKKIQDKSGELLEIVGLKDVKQKIGGYSRGMKQRLGIAQALLNDPRLLLCDEPTSALDPVGRKEILDILSVVKSQMTVVFSTHILSDVERICDRVAVLHDGKLALCGGLEELKSGHKRDEMILELTNEQDARRLQEILTKTEGITAVGRTRFALTIQVQDVQKSSLQILSLVLREQMQVLKYEVQEPNLETLFMEVVK